MPDDVLPVIPGAKTTDPIISSPSLEADFPTLKSPPPPPPTNPPTPTLPVNPLATSTQVPPVSQISSPSPVSTPISSTSLTSITIAPVTPTPTASPNPLPPLTPSSPPTSIFTPLGGHTPSTTPNKTASLPNMQYGTRPLRNGGFETLGKVIGNDPPKEDLALTATNIFPDTVPQIQKSGNPLVLIGIIFSIFTITALSFAAIYSIAYGYININNPEVTNTLSNFVQSLPLTPKTPQYLLTQTTITQKNITKETFDLSLAVRSKELESVFNSTSAEAAFKGSIDYTDLKNPKMSINASVTKDFNADLKAQDHKIYFHLNKLPLPLLAIAGLSEEDIKPLIKDWVYYDTTPLETEANKILDSKTDSEEPYQEFIQKIENIIFNDQILNNITVTDDTLDKTSTYKLHFEAKPETIDYLDRALNKEFNEQASVKSDKKASDFVKDFVVDMWIENNTHYLRKLNISFRVVDEKPDPKLGTQNSSSDVAISYSLSDIGKDFTVDIPQSPISLDKFILQIQQKFTEIAQQKQYAIDSNQSSPSSYPIY